MKRMLLVIGGGVELYILQSIAYSIGITNVWAHFLIAALVVVPVSMAIFDYRQPIQPPQRNELRIKIGNTVIVINETEANQ